MPPTVKAVLHEDEDGVQVNIRNLSTGREAIYRVDKSLDAGNNVLYRMDQKPTTRSHTLIGGDPLQWVEQNIDLLSRSVM